MATTSEIKNLALFELGWNEDVSFTGTLTKTAQTVNRVYTQQFNSIIEQFDWSFQTLTANQTSATAESNAQYNYSYVLPDDFLRLVNVFSDSSQRLPITEYFIDAENSKIYVDTSQGIYLKYITSADKTLPNYFIDYFVYDLASKLCMNLTGDTDLLKVLEAKRDRAKTLAFRIDTKQKQPKRIINANKYLAIRG